MPNCTKCHVPTDYSLSEDHPEPYAGQWLCLQCYRKLVLKTAEKQEVS